MSEPLLSCADIRAAIRRAGFQLVEVRVEGEAGNPKDTKTIGWDVAIWTDGAGATVRSGPDLRSALEKAAKVVEAYLENRGCS